MHMHFLPVQQQKEKGKDWIYQAMGQKLGRLWERIQGKGQVRRICDKVFDQCAERDLLSLDKLHLATLLVYDAINKRLPGAHKDPPSMERMKVEVEVLRSETTGMIDREKFHALISKWAEKDMRKYLANKIALALLAAPAMVSITKNAGRQVPRIGHAIERIPTPILVPAYTVGFVLLQDAGA